MVEKPVPEDESGKLSCQGERNYNELQPTLCFPEAYLGNHRKRFAIKAKNTINCIRQPQRQGVYRRPEAK
jgi:hypothetical protein